MNLENLKTFRFPSIVHQYTAVDSILYALGLGFGERPMDPMHLQFVYENGLRGSPIHVHGFGPPRFLDRFAILADRLDQAVATRHRCKSGGPIPHLPLRGSR